MSYVVEILTGEIPADYEHAIALRDELLDAHDSRLALAGDSPFEAASPELSELHRRLTARYPCICDDESGPWSDGPLINNFGLHEATVGISFSRVEEVLPFLIQTSTAMGYWVFDGQDEAAHVPNGVILRQKSQPAPQANGRPWWQFWK
jgi:hypothetical protein